MSEIIKKTNKNSPDYILLTTVFLLLGLGTIMIFSSSQAVGYDHFNDSFYFIKRHIVYLLIGLASFFLAHKIDYKLYKEYSFHILILTLALLLLTYIPGISIHAFGARRWINMGFFSFQPSEMAKLAMIIFVATSLSNRQFHIRSLRHGILPILTICFLIVLFIVLQPDLSTTMLIIMTTFVMIYAAGAKTWQLFIITLIGFRLMLWVIWRSSYQKDRVLGFLNPEKYALSIGFHIIQSKLAIGSGGIFGLGLGGSRQKFYYLPQQFTDFIFAILCEELGIIGAIFVIILFIVFIWRGLIIASKAPDFFSKYMCFGIVVWLSLQAFINIAVVLGLMPTTGIPLTFISFGGTSLVMNMFAVGILTHISTLAPKEKKS